MIELQQLYGWADPIFYESPAEWVGTEGVFPATEREAPEGWSRIAEDVWVRLMPEKGDFPLQGWKIHVSATGEHAQRVVDIVWDHCVERGVPFKFLRDLHLFRLFNSKYMARGSSGKLVAVYPADEAQLEELLTALEGPLSGVPGPTILSDLRWTGTPLHVRYGGFAKRYCVDSDGDQVLAIAGPDGELVPDERRPGRYAPEWVTLPDFLEPHRTRRRTNPEDFPYQVSRALHFSNGGGVYLGTRNADGRDVVLKEARPGAGLDMMGRDAVERQQRERDALAKLAGTPGVPELYDHIEVDGHRFLVMEHLHGDVLWAWMSTYNPLLHRDNPPMSEEEYIERAIALVDKVEVVVRQMHDHGLIFGDLHPGNVFVTPEGEVSLLDFETTFEMSEPEARPRMGAQGFQAPESLDGTDIDLYALDMLRLWMFFPLNRLYRLSPTKCEEIIGIAERRYSLLPEGFGDRIRATVERARRATPTEVRSSSLAAAHRRRMELLADPPEVDLGVPEVDWSAARESLARAIIASAQPDRGDRLFPGDVEQFNHDGVHFSHGAAGVLWALNATGQGRFEEYERWLSERAHADASLRPGFYTGLHGIAHVLDEFGHHEDARRLLERAAPMVARTADVSLSGGLTGAGLNLLHLGRRHDDAELRAQAVTLGERVLESVTALEHPAAPKPRRAGFLHGFSGAGLFLLRLHQETGDVSWLDAAVRALHRDLDACVQRENGSLQVNDKVRTLAYLEVGSGGIALVADELLSVRGDARLAEALPLIRRALLTEFVVESQLYNGRAGLMAMVARLAHRDPTPESAECVDRHLRNLAWHQLSFKGHLAFPGEQSYRLSMDLATGNAGVLLGIDAATDGTSPFLPFLSPRRLPHLVTAP